MKLAPIDQETQVNSPLEATVNMPKGGFCYFEPQIAPKL